jgi:hypothetical protein
VLEKMQAGGTQSGASASMTADAMLTQMQSGIREGRAVSLRAAQALAEGYSAMVSGVLLGMSEALKQGSASEAPAAAANKSAGRRK